MKGGFENGFVVKRERSTRGGAWALRRARRQARGGWVILDAVLGLALVAMLMTLFTVSLSQQARAEKVMSQQREAARELDRAAVVLRAGEGLADDAVQVEDVGGGWARLTTQAGVGEVELFVKLTVASEPGGEGGER